MSIFGKKKENAPPAPPIPSGGGLNDIKSEISGNQGNNVTDENSKLPPPPGSSAAMSSSTSSVQSMQTNGVSNRNSSTSSPSFDPSNISKNNGFNQNNENSSLNSSSTMNNSNLNLAKKSVLDESLFNLEDFELPNLDDLDDIDMKVKTLENKNSNTYNETSSNSLTSNFNNSSSKSQSHNLKSEHFIPTKGLSASDKETFFLTTNEFKHLLELVDSVKDRVRISTQRHMKITTIKAEEDIEYENMKKDFQFIEDKLYEVDSTIFER
ncbi:MAG: hypothetical protein LAT82_01720 [Nanoarchaeota archaeon]|nr:hypothetical protein [Nanoarchaeota archaeon]